MDEDKRIRIPWAAKATGAWNGDMFEDWYRNEPMDELERQLWAFLHNWEKSMKLEALDTVVDKIRAEVIKS